MVSPTTQVWQGLGINENNCSAKIIKVVAGENRESLEISRIYNTIIDAGVY